MRDIKFRAWNNGRKKMLHSDDDSITLWEDLADDSTQFYIADINDIFTNKYFKFMQYTGLKDKNGVEIYEGDILGHDTRHLAKTGIKTLHVVEYEVYNLSSARSGFLLAAPLHHFEVIGNIYENPELLK